MTEQIVLPNGNKIWFLNGVKHNENGPAEIWADGSQFYLINGKLHRDDNLPAIIMSDGSQYWSSREDKLPIYLDVKSMTLTYKYSRAPIPMSWDDYDKYRYKKTEPLRIKSAR